MHHTESNLIEINNKIKSKINSLSLDQYNPKVIAVSKTFKEQDISPLLDYCHLDFGENKVQEAVDKWSDVKFNSPNLNLHMIGKLQTNKVKYAVKIFDYIHSLDSIKLAKKISEEQNKIKKKLKIFIQVNIGNETQKSGVSVDDLPNFYKQCVDEFNLNIIGLMCLPPINNEPSKYFKQMYSLVKDLSLKELSMGMSNDYLKAVENGATYIRIGSKIFGARN